MSSSAAELKRDDIKCIAIQLEKKRESKIGWFKAGVKWSLIVECELWSFVEKWTFSLSNVDGRWKN